MNELLENIHTLAKTIPRNITLMEVCGGHTNTVMKYGIRDILPKNVRLISGPGCPVCVTAQEDIDAMIALARSGLPIASYADMMHVFGTKLSLDKAKEQGADVAVIASATEMLKEENKHRIFFAIGFETTTPMTAYLLEHGVTVYSAHKTMPEPMKAVVQDTKVDAFIGPGHVSCIIGTQAYKELGVPLVVAGFEPEQILHAVYLLLQMIAQGKKEVINDYDEVVKEEGNLKAQNLIARHLIPCDSLWRGLGLLPNSGMEVRSDKQNAKILYKNILEKQEASKENPICRCAEILKGHCEPQDCPLFGKSCTPKTPKGACMVSEAEGACAIAYQYKKQEEN